MEPKKAGTRRRVSESLFSRPLPAAAVLQCCRVCVLGLRLRLLWFVLALVSVAMGTLKSRTSLSSLVVEEAVSVQH